MYMCMNDYVSHQLWKIREREWEHKTLLGKWPGAKSKRQ